MEVKEGASLGFNGRMNELDLKFHCPFCGKLFGIKDGTNDRVFVCSNCSYEKLI